MARQSIVVRLSPPAPVATLTAPAANVLKSTLTAPRTFPRIIIHQAMHDDTSEDSGLPDGPPDSGSVAPVAPAAPAPVATLADHVATRLVAPRSSRPRRLPIAKLLPPAPVAPVAPAAPAPVATLPVAKPIPTLTPAPVATRLPKAYQASRRLLFQSLALSVPRISTLTALDGTKLVGLVESVKRRDDSGRVFDVTVQTAEGKVIAGVYAV